MRPPVALGSSLESCFRRECVVMPIYIVSFAKEPYKRDHVCVCVCVSLGSSPESCFRRECVVMLPMGRVTRMHWSCSM